MNPTDNPFSSLTLIVAPAILTNASTLLVLSTSNRLARTLDRARKLTDEFEQREAGGEFLEGMYLRELHSAEDRTLILMRSLQAFYFALGGFAGAAFLSLIGAVLATSTNPFLRGIEIFAVGVGTTAVGALVYGSALLVKETKIAVRIIHEQAQHVQSRIKGRLVADPAKEKK
jgi:hypothetical protein